VETEHPDTCSHVELEDCLRSAGAEGSASFTHGLLCGIAVVTGGSRRGLWEEPVLGAGNTLSAAAQECLVQLGRVQTAILAGLHDDALGFQPLLPAETRPITVRTRALGEWCEGFLYGLALGGLREQSAMSETVREVMRDFYEISHAGFHLDEPEEEDEAALVEIVEYVRMGVLLLFEEVQPSNIPARLQ
jgi:uncharacterized protein YgfB (UPF0149 family)